MDNEVKIGLMKFPNEWQYEYDEIVLHSKQYVADNFEEWFLRNQVPRNHNVEAYIAFSKRITKGLYAFELNEHAQRVNDNVRDISRTFEITAQINTRIAELAGLDLPSTIEGCAALRKRVELLREDIEINTLKERHKEEYYKTLDVLIERIDNQINELNDDIASIWISLQMRKLNQLKS